MSILTFATMAVVLTVVWGGFLAALIAALRKEKRKDS